ncbi:hypothetical protein pkur_cds_89 [Pandoravirus kuranda]|uniref:Uncharacterized protein n=1 Tax=Pandoravirus kuranda TaxID=3019033 RepID=A0AA95J1Y5_9VIRU|nr:hypothetical protein pkur_cds_89 [Pandoravirus kuranda]
MTGARYPAPPKRAKAPRRQESTRYIVAEIYGCYRSGWASFSLCAIALAAASQGLIAPTVPKGARIVSAFDLCPSLEGQSMRSAGGLVYDAIVVVAAWPGRPRTDWVSVQFRDDGSDYCSSSSDDDDDDEKDDGTDDSDEGESNDEDAVGDSCATPLANGDSSEADAHRRAGHRENARMSPPRDLMVAAAHAAGDDLNEFIDAIAQHPQFPQRCTPSGIAPPSGVRWWIRTKRPKIDGAFSVGRNGSLSLVCDECTGGKARCPSCVGVWSDTRRLWPPAYDDGTKGDDAFDPSRGIATRRSVPLRQSVRRVVSAIVAARTPGTDAPAPMHDLAASIVKPTTTPKTTATTQRAPRVRVRGPIHLSEIQGGGDVPESASTGSFVSGPRCGRHRCPSPCRRVDTESATHVWVHCDRGCCALFHRACWRAAGGTLPAPLGLAGGPMRVRCVTPDCWGHLTRVVSFAPGALNLGRVEWEEGKASAKGTKDSGKPRAWRPTAGDIAATNDHGPPNDDAASDMDAHANTVQHTLRDALCRGNQGAANDDEGNDKDGGDGGGGDRDNDHDGAGPRETTTGVIDHQANGQTDAIAVDLARPAVIYRKSAPMYGDGTRTQAKRTRVRAQKKQRLRARQKHMTLAEWHDSAKAPQTNPWAGDDALWPTFFVAQDADDPTRRPRRDSTAVPERLTKPTTEWRFAVWDPVERTVSKDRVMTPALRATRA